MIAEINGRQPAFARGKDGIAVSHALPTLENRWPLRPFQIVSLLSVYSLNIELFLVIIREIETWRSMSHVRTALGRRVFDKDHLQDVEAKLRLISEACEKAGLDTVTPHVERMLKRIEKKGKKYDSNDLHIDANELHFRIQDEMSNVPVMRIPKDRQGFYENPFKGWESLVDRFPQARSDVEEAHKCYALARYSAAVFHSLQIIEVGLVDLGTFINVNDPISGWTAVTKRLKKILDTKCQDLSEFEKANRVFLEQLFGTVEALKNAWRNKISHAHGKLTVMTGEEFHPEVTEEILLATRAFMRRLAAGLPPKLV